MLGEEIGEEGYNGWEGEGTAPVGEEGTNIAANENAANVSSGSLVGSLKNEEAFKNEGKPDGVKEGNKDGNEGGDEDEPEVLTRYYTIQLTIKKAF